MKDIPLSEITLRKYEKPYNIDKRQLVKKICLSLGLLQPGDGRDVIVDILLVLLEEKEKKSKLTSDQIKIRVEELRKKHNLEIRGVAESNIRRQLKRLRDVMLVDKKENLYSISEFEHLHTLFEQRIEKLLVQPSIDRIKEYLKELEK
ncbi:MAG TPA: hypothetical protein VI815_04390 [Candidatus Nanoarchaeia archaeon]|nr:hypothetical protein [Candidatus Nanoarchaeia archaeon]